MGSCSCKSNLIWVFLYLPNQKSPFPRVFPAFFFPSCFRIWRKCCLFYVKLSFIVTQILISGQFSSREWFSEATSPTCCFPLNSWLFFSGHLCKLPLLQLQVLSAAAPYSAGVEFVGKIPTVFCIKTEVWEQIVSLGGWYKYILFWGGWDRKVELSNSRRFTLFFLFLH